MTYTYDNITKELRTQKKFIKKNINTQNLEYFLNKFFINKRKKIKSNKNIKILIDTSVVNKRYEDLKYAEILDIYKRFNFSLC